jgi:8-oxo-dGTP pyrophosphatase MutT (NUDIX family)
VNRAVNSPRRSIPDPLQAPIDRSVPVLPAIAPERLQAAWLRTRFSQAPDWTPEHIDDRFRLDTATPRPAAVLIPLVMRPPGLTVLLTERTAHLSSHAGQVAFPGGRTEPHDPSAVATALRETEEEIGLSRVHVEIIGQLPQYITGSGFAVTPVVGLVEPSHSLTIDDNEVAEIFEVPLEFLMNPAHHQRRVYAWEDGAQRGFLAMPWRRPDGREHFIWGVTAAMLRNLYRFLSA